MRTTLQIALILLFFSLNTHAQHMRDSQAKALDSLQKLKPLFRNSLNDTLFINEYSQGSFQTYTFSRGDHAVDIDEQIYSANVGDVVGPFRGYDSSNYLFKVMSYDGYTLRSRANLIYLKPNNESKQDTATISKLTAKYLEYFKKGKDIETHAHKEDIRVVIKDLMWFYEGENEKEYYEQLFSMEKGAGVILNTKNGPAILIITTSKEKTPFMVKLIGVMRKG